MIIYIVISDDVKIQKTSNEYILEQFLAPTVDCGSGFRFSVTKMKSCYSICWFISIQLSLLAFFTFVFKLLAC